MLPADRGIPSLRSVSISNLTINSSATAIAIEGLLDSPIRDFALKNVLIHTESAGSIKYVKDWELTNVEIKTSDGSTLQLMPLTPQSYEY